MASEQDGYFLFFMFRIATIRRPAVSIIMNSSYVLIIINPFPQDSERVRARPPAAQVSLLYCHGAVDPAAGGSDQGRQEADQGPAARKLIILTGELSLVRRSDSMTAQDCAGATGDKCPPLSWAVNGTEPRLIFDRGLLCRISRSGHLSGRWQPIVYKKSGLLQYFLISSSSDTLLTASSFPVSLSALMLARIFAIASFSVSSALS